jgi:hypothetical protein
MPQGRLTFRSMALRICWRHSATSYPISGISWPIGAFGTSKISFLSLLSFPPSNHRTDHTWGDTLRVDTYVLMGIDQIYSSQGIFVISSLSLRFYLHSFCLKGIVRVDGTLHLENHFAPMSCASSASVLFCFSLSTLLHLQHGPLLPLDITANLQSVKSIARGDAHVCTLRYSLPAIHL